MKYLVLFLLPISIACGQVSSENKSTDSANLVNVNFSINSPLDSSFYNVPWLDSFSIENTIINRIELPDGFTREKDIVGSFAHWLRRLPLKQGKPEVKLYNGELKWNQNAHMYVVNIDVGERDLQQCADATMRLRAEYLYEVKKLDSIHFNYTNGANVSFAKWRNGLYPVPKSGKVDWVNSPKNNSSYSSFKKYMVQIFNYAGTLSLSRELNNIELNAIQPGDIFVYGGSPGHAVMVLDVAKNKFGETIFLLAQSYMPAQEIHVLKNPNNSDLSPWYSLSEIKGELVTPEWTFDKDELMRWN